jgi:IS5 family transposase
MLRMYFLQQWYTLSRRGVWRTRCTTARPCASSWASTWAEQNVPDATTLLKFRRLLEAARPDRGHPGEQVNAHLSERGLLMREGTVVDATIIAAPSSTKNEDGKPATRRCTRPRRATSGTSA